MDKLNISLEFLKLLSTTSSKILIIKNISCPIQQICYPMVMARFLMTNAIIDQLLEHQNQNANLFDFDQLLISIQIGSIEKTCVSEALKTDITYLLSLCEHGDLHLRGACASLLATLIQTTIHLLLNNVHLYQLIHKTVQGIKLLEDSIQHTTSSCILAEFALAQLMDDIDFRILTYLEQQLKQQYPDIRVRQAIASTFANKRKNVLKVAQMIQNEKDSSTTSNTDKDKKVNRTRLGTLRNNPSMIKLFELIRSSYQLHKILSLISTQDLSKKFGRETLNYFKSTFNVHK
ncbi:unnamed protein product, partial [Rotaria sp. Silwood1]